MAIKITRQDKEVFLCRCGSGDMGLTTEKFEEFLKDLGERYEEARVEMASMKCTSMYVKIDHQSYYPEHISFEFVGFRRETEKEAKERFKLDSFDDVCNYQNHLEYVAKLEAKYGKKFLAKARRNL